MSENLIWQSKTERARSFEEFQRAARDTLHVYAGWRRDQERPNEQAIRSRVRLAPPVGALAAEVFERLTGAGMAEDQATTVAAETAATVMVRRQAGAPEQADKVLDASAELIDQVADGRDESVALADFREAIVGWRSDGDTGGRLGQPVLVTFDDGTVVPDGVEVVPGIRETGPRHSIVAPQVASGIEAYLTARGEGLDIPDALDRAGTTPGVREAVSEFADDVELYGTDIDTARTGAVAGAVADAALGQFQSLRNAGVDADQAAVTAAGGDPVALHAIGGFVARVRDGFPEDIATPDAWAAAVTAVHMGERYQGDIPDGVELPGYHFSREFGRWAIEKHTPGTAPEDREGIDVEAVRRYDWLTRHGMDPGEASRLAAVDTAVYRAQLQAREDADAIDAAEAVIRNVGSDLDLAHAVEEDGDGFEPDVPDPVADDAEQLAFDHNERVGRDAAERFEKARQDGRSEDAAAAEVLGTFPVEDVPVADTALGHYQEFRRDGFAPDTAAELAAEVAADELTPFEFGHEPTADDHNTDTDTDTAIVEEPDAVTFDVDGLIQAATRLAAERHRDIAFLRSTAAASATDPVVRARLEREAAEATAAADGYAARATELADGNDPWDEVEIAEQVEQARVAATHDVLDGPEETTEQLRRREIADATMLSYLTWQQEGIPPEEIAQRLERVSPVGAKAVRDYEQLLTIGYEPDDARAIAADTATQDPIPTTTPVVEDPDVVVIDPDELMPAGEAMRNYFVAEDAVGRFAQLRSEGWDDDAAHRRAVEASDDDPRLANAAVLSYRSQLAAGQDHEAARSTAVSDTAAEFTPRISAEQADQVRAALTHPADAAANTAAHDTGDESTVDTNELTNSAQDTGLREDYDDIFSEEAYAERDTTGAADTDDVVALIDQVLDVDQGEPRADGEDVESTDADAGFWAEVAQRRDALIADGVEMNEAADRAWLDVCGERGIDPASTVSTAQPDESGFDSAVGEHDVDDTGIAYMAPTSPLPERAPEAGSWIARNLTYHEQADVDDENDDSDSDSDSDDDTEPPFAERVAECERAVEEVEVVVQHHERTDEDTERAERCTRWNADDAADEQADEDTEGWGQ